jgi:hypothetical protein
LYAQVPGIRVAIEALSVARAPKSVSFKLLAAPPGEAVIVMWQWRWLL